MGATQKTIAELFGVDRSVITKHLKNIYLEKELNKNSTCVKIAHVQNEGKRKVKRKTTFYNLDAIISVGYRVNSKKATDFRIWSNNVLKEYIIKGYVLDDELLKNGTRFGKDYFDKLLERIRDIRTSERRSYQKITDLYATSFDYNKDAKITQEFYAKVQNKLHYAILGKTAPEIIYDCADANKDNMGLTNWLGSPNSKIMLSDTKIAKNYLTEDELDELNRIVDLYLGYGELQAKKEIPMSMNDWSKQLDKFLEFTGYEILKGKGNISRKNVDEFLKKEFDKFKPIQNELYESDYDKFTHQTKLLV